MCKHQQQALFDNVSYLVTYSITLLFSSSICVFLCLPWDAFIDNLNMIFRQFIFLFWSCTWIIQVCCRQCHRSVLYEITMQFTVRSLSISSLRCLTLVVTVSLSLWCQRWKTLRHKFVLFLSLERTEVFSQTACFLSRLEGTTVAMCQTNGNKCVSYYRIL